jgi:SagB-type dehydrogenase family enzyme
MTIENADLVSAQASTEREGQFYSLPDLFLENTKLHPYNAVELGGRIMRFFSDPRKIAASRQTFKSYPMAERVLLPPLESLAGVGFDSVIRSRRSARLSSDAPGFSATPMTLSALGQLLFYSYGISHSDAPDVGHAGHDGHDGHQHAEQKQEEGSMPRTIPPMRYRTAPSGGGLFPLELYAVVLNVDGVAPGAYHYNVAGHYLEMVREAGASGFTEEAFALLSRGASYENTGIILFTTGVPVRTSFKYGDRGYRFLLIETGHVAQNSYLAATALGLSACALGGFLDDAIHGFLGLDGLDELVLYALLVGSPHDA